MFKLLQRIRRYFTTAGNMKFNEVADPKVQLEQAITEAQDQHRRLIEQAANVVANQKQTEMRLNRSMAELSETVGQDVPTFDEVRDKIEQLYARALGASEIAGESVESLMLEVEQAAMNTEATARLDAIRAQLGIASAPAATADAPPAIADA